MNNQIRKIFVIVLLMFALLGVGVTNTQFISASSLNADARNQRTFLHAAETARGPIIVDKTAIASSEREEDSKRYVRTYAEGPLYAPVTGYFSSVGNASTGIEAAEEDVLDGQSQTLLGQRLRNLLTGQNRQGGGVSLTLNSQMQKAAAEALGWATARAPSWPSTPKLARSWRCTRRRPSTRTSWPPPTPTR